MSAPDFTAGRELADQQVRYAAHVARKLGLENTLTLAEWWALLDRHGFRCATAGCRSVEHPQIDHVVPLSCGGSNALENVQPLCAAHHKAKAAVDRRGGNGRRRPRGYADWRPQAKTRVLLEQVQQVLVEYEEYLPLTVRQVFYRLVGVFDYPKDEHAYARLCEHLVRARRARLIPFESLRDDGVTVINRCWYDDTADFWDHVAQQARAYKRDKQTGQPVYVELWTEAAGMMPQIERVAAPFSVPVYSCGGFASLTAVRHIVDRACKRNVPTVLLHVGDFDPSGEAIFDHIAGDAAAFLGEDRIIHTLGIVAERVALTHAQVAEYDLPTSPAKQTDSRSAKWKGGTCQLEALRPDVLAGIVHAAIERRLDYDRVLQHRAGEYADRVQLLQALPSGEATS